ncbi:MAG TPA: anti-sigma factor [Pyrinomonadaceae bacterium]|nr:anti-sigma factor [Pyrinomonadaceae bacterium]
MNCDKCQDLVSDFLDGALSQEDQKTLNLHLEECLSCADVRTDLESIVSFCRTSRGEYIAPPNEKALWMRIRNVIEAGAAPAFARAAPAPRQNFLPNWIGRTWELSFPQLAASVAAIVLLVSLSTAVGMRGLQRGDVTKSTVSSAENLSLAAANLRNRINQQQQAIDYWNQRVEYNKTRWNPEMRETFDRNLKVIDQAVTASFDSLSSNPHDEVSEEMLNAALNEKLALLKEFAEL